MITARLKKAGNMVGAVLVTTIIINYPIFTVNTFLSKNYFYTFNYFPVNILAYAFTIMSTSFRNYP